MRVMGNNWNYVEDLLLLKCMFFVGLNFTQELFN
jgi:hypothetical protein